MKTLNQLLVEALLDKQYPQKMVMSPDSFISHVRKFNIPITREYLETWDRLGILHPIVIVRENPCIIRSPILRRWREQYDDLVIVPSKETFLPWGNYEDSETFLPHTSLFYHPYQIFRLREIYWKSRLTYSFFDFDIHADNWNDDIKGIRGEMARNLGDLQKSTDEYARMLRLFLLIEDRYLPQVKSSLETGNLALSSQEIWDDLVNTFKPNDVLGSSGLTVEEIQVFRKKIAMTAYTVDPNFEWFVLIRHATLDWRQRLRKEALLAWEYYEVAEVLGHFLKDVTDTPQPHVDDLVHSSLETWKHRYYGISPDEFDYNRGNALPPILRRFGLDPRIRVLFLVEGEAEEVFINTWCERHNIFLERWGVRLTSLNSNQTLKSRPIKQLISKVKLDGTSVVVVVDDENDTRQQLQDWVDSKHIQRIFTIADLSEPQMSPIGGMLWNNVFEESNFTSEELLSAWKIARFTRFPDTDAQKFQVAAQNVKEKVEKGVCNSVSHAIDKTNRNFSVGKPDMARALANQCNDANKPIIKLINQILRFASFAHTARYWSSPASSPISNHGEVSSESTPANNTE